MVNGKFSIIFRLSGCVLEAELNESPDVAIQKNSPNHRLYYGNKLILNLLAKLVSKFFAV